MFPYNPNGQSGSAKSEDTAWLISEACEAGSAAAQRQPLRGGCEHPVGGNMDTGWGKSSYSGSNGDCIEARFKKSSYSNPAHRPLRGSAAAGHGAGP